MKNDLNAENSKNFIGWRRFIFSDEIKTIRQSIVLDTQEQREAKGAKRCPHCGVFGATEHEGE